MVTAIVIPIICIYFYWLTKKEMRIHKEKWLALENITEESILKGTIQNIEKEKQRFYYHYYNQVITLTLKTEHKTYIVKKVSPIHDNTAPFLNQVGDNVLIYGKWENGYFLLNRIEKVNMTEKK